MPDDWPGHPQRKDYPLGGIPVEYKGATDPAAGRAEVLQLMTPPSARDPYAAAAPRPPRAGSSPSPARTGTRSSTGIAEEADERVVVNMGPQHPSTHGVLRLILELEGETVTEARCGIGYLHTGIEKNMEFRTWTQGVTFCTRMDYLSPFYNEATYCLGVERLLDIEDDIPEKAQVIRVLLMELNRISSHLVCIATGGMEIGALTVMTIGFRERELVLDLFELITGLRMNHAFIRPGGVAQDLPPGALDQIRDFVALMKKRLPGVRRPAATPTRSSRAGSRASATSTSPAAWRSASPARCCARPATPWDLRKTAALLRLRGLRLRRRRPGTPATPTAASGSGSTRCGSRCKIVEQAAERLAGLEGAPVMVADKKIAWPASSRSAATAWATASTTSGTSWASRWRP